MNPPLMTEQEDQASQLQHVQAQLEEIVAASGRVQLAQENLVRAHALARGHMADSKVRYLLLRLKEAAGLNEGMSEQWSTLLNECPDDLEIVRYCATRLVKERHLDDALALVDRHLPETSKSPARLFARAKLLSDIRAHEQSDALFRRLIAHYPDRNMRIEFAKRLRKRGLRGARLCVQLCLVHRIGGGGTGGDVGHLPFLACITDRNGVGARCLGAGAQRHAVGAGGAGTRTNRHRVAALGAGAAIDRALVQHLAVEHHAVRAAPNLDRLRRSDAGHAQSHCQGQRCSQSCRRGIGRTAALVDDPA